MQNKFSEQPTAVCLLLMLGCTTVLGGDLGLGFLERIDDFHEITSKGLEVL
jgi:hypothetical protein